MLAPIVTARRAIRNRSLRGPGIPQATTRDPHCPSGVLIHVGRASGSGDGLILGGTVVVPSVVAMNLRLTDAESEALRAKAEQEGRSMQEVARTAIAQYVSDRPQRLAAAIQRVRTEDDELLERLSR